jgi:hypothetical protein
MVVPKSSDELSMIYGIQRSMAITAAIAAPLISLVLLMESPDHPRIDPFACDRITGRNISYDPAK